MSMDGNNRTLIIKENRTEQYYHDRILSFTVDYQGQMLYWVFSDYADDYICNLIIKRSNIDGTNQQTIYYYDHNRWYCYTILETPPGLAIHEETLILSLPWMREVHRLGTNGANFNIFINDSVLCRVKYLLKVTKQPVGEFNIA